MSNFYCEHCGALCADSPRGYFLGCEHYPPDDNAVQYESAQTPGDFSRYIREQHERVLRKKMKGGDASC